MNAGYEIGSVTSIKGLLCIASHCDDKFERIEAPIITLRQASDRMLSFLAFVLPNKYLVLRTPAQNSLLKSSTFALIALNKAPNSLRALT